MIRVRLQLDRNGLLASCTAEGHAAVLAESGSIPCAAASTLLRTAGRLIEARKGVDHSGEAPAEGRMSLRIERCARGQRAWLRGVTDYLLAGMQDLEREYPDECRVEIRVKE